MWSFTYINDTIGVLDRPTVGVCSKAALCRILGGDESCQMTTCALAV